MNTGSLPKDQAELDEFRRLRGQEELLDELHEMYETDAFEDFWKSPASLVLSPWLDRKTKEVRERLAELTELIKQKYEV